MMKPHHIGYLVKDIEKAAVEFQELGYTVVSEVVYDQYRDIDICFMRNEELCVELVSPKSENSVVAGLMKKIGAAPYHICYLVEDVEVVGAFLRKRKYVPMGEAMPAPALHNSPAVFYFHRQLGIVELIQHD